MDHFCRLCFDRYLPHEPMIPAMALDPRARAVLFFRKLWPNGSTLRVRFMGGTETQQRLALEQGRWWCDHANLRLVPSDATNAEIRVSFDPTDGAWSYIGTDCSSIPTDQPTMNLGFQDGGTSAHEFGHAIGLGHEHQNPQGGLQWNEPEVIRDLSGPPNSWTVDQIRSNVLTKYSVDQVRGTVFDADSIMLYAFPSRWTTNGIGTHNNDVLSAQDRSFIATTYPRPVTPGPTPPGPTPPTPPAEPTRLTVNSGDVSGKIGAPGEEDQFLFTVSQVGRHVMETHGKTDLVMKLYGPNNRTWLIAEDDDDGIGLNPRISRVLASGEYLLQIRHYNSSGGTGPYTIRVRR
jgi:Astacin (Peptidase family M12A)